MKFLKKTNSTEGYLFPSNLVKAPMRAKLKVARTMFSAPLSFKEDLMII
jgi:hypothetical protein